MFWAIFLHFYQPPVQKRYWIKRITKEAYRPILAGLEKRPQTKVTFNINGALFEHFENYGEHDVIDLVKKLLDRGQIELTGSAKYHPLLPFLPEEETVRQIKLNEETLKHYFGDSWKKEGFFPPEMGFSINEAKIVKELGYKWVIADELSFPKSGGKINYKKIYTILGLGDFQIYFRERKTSWVILSGQVGTEDLLLKHLSKRLDSGEYLLTAMDGETFGHHRPGLEQLLFELCDSSSIQNILVSDLPNHFSDFESVSPKQSTWALMEKDLEKKKPFSRWKDPDNEIHTLQWKLTDLAISSIKNSDDKNPLWAKARKTLDRALHSDQYWWASARPWWSIEMIERGAKELLDAINSAPNTKENAHKKAQDLYSKILFTAFDWQRSGRVDELSKKEDEDVRQRTDSAIPRLPKKEIDKMIKTLESEMDVVVKNQEFERATQLRDRIKELKGYSASVKKPKFSEEGGREFD